MGVTRNRAGNPVRFLVMPVFLKIFPWTHPHKTPVLSHTIHEVRNHMKKDVPNQPQPQKEPAKNDPYGCDDPDALNIRACSATDCTGLIPALPVSDAELESYAEVYHYPADIFHD